MPTPSELAVARGDEWGESEGGSEIHLKDYLRVVWQRRWVLVGWFCVVLGLAAAYTFTRTPTYLATAVVLIEPDQVNVANVEDVFSAQGNQGSGWRDYFRTQYELLRSRRVAEPVFEDLRFEERPGFALSRDPVGVFLDRIVISPLRDTRLVQVGFESPDPVLAARTANALVDSFVQDSRQRALGISDAGLAQLRERAKELKIKVEDTTQRLESLKRDLQMVLIDEGQTVGTARLAALNESLGQAQTARLLAEARLEALTDTGISGVDFERTQVLRSRLTEAEVALASVSLRLGAAHPQRLGLEREVEQLRGVLEQAQTSLLAETLAQLRAEVAQARRLEETLEVVLQEQTDALFRSHERQGEYELLLRERDTLAETYQGVTVRIEEIELATSTGQQKDHIFSIEQATTPTKTFKPNVVRNMGLAFVLGLVGGVAMCFFVEYLDRSVKSAEELEQLLGAPTVGHVPAVDAESEVALELAALSDPRSELAEAFRAIRTGVAFGVVPRAPGRGRVVLVTSALPSDGKSLTSVNLSIALAQWGKRVLLIDADLRRPRIGSVFGLEAGDGLSHLLVGEYDPEDVPELTASPEGLASLEVLQAGAIPPNPADLLQSDRMGRLLEEVEGRYDWVILDCPPMVVADPAILLSTHVPNGLFVARSFRTPKELIRQAGQRLGSVGGRLAGAVLNGCDAPRSPGGYGYGYGYGYTASYRQAEEGSGGGA